MPWCINLLGLIVPVFILDSSSGISIVISSDGPEKFIVATDDALAFSPCTLDRHKNDIMGLKVHLSVLTWTVVVVLEFTSNKAVDLDM